MSHALARAAAFGSTHSKPVLLACLLAAGLVFSQDSLAGWLTWVGVALIVASVVAAAVSAAPVVVAVLVVAGVAAVAADFVSTAFGSEIATHQSQPGAAAGTQPAAANVSLPESLSHITAPGGEGQALADVANDALDAANTLHDAVASHSSTAADDFGHLSDALAQVAAAYDTEVGSTDTTLTQLDLDATIADIAADGLPTSVQGSLQQIGLSNAEIDALAAALDDQPIELSTADINGLQLIAAASQIELVSEPGSHTLAPAALLLAALALRRRRCAG